jgi:hypothetical protein
MSYLALSAMTAQAPPVCSFGTLKVIGPPMVCHWLLRACHTGILRLFCRQEQFPPRVALEKNQTRLFVPFLFGKARAK